MCAGSTRTFLFNEIHSANESKIKMICQNNVTSRNNGENINYVHKTCNYVIFTCLGSISCDLGINLPFVLFQLSYKKENVITVKIIKTNKQTKQQGLL